MKRRTVECFVLILALLVSLLSVSALAAPPEEDAALSAEDVVINTADETLYNDGGTVINNFGIVYNNGGTVYNNGGTVYNNEGLVYNNGGIVYNNGAQVYNNGGTVHNNGGGTVYETEPVAAGEEKGSPDKEKDGKSGSADGLFAVELAGDYSRLADIEGLEKRPDGSFAISPEGSATIKAKPGLILTDAICTAGTCSLNDDGSVTLANVDRDGVLTLKFELPLPESNLEGGCYGKDQHLSLSAGAEGAKVLYTTDGRSPLEYGREFKGRTKLEDSVVIKAAAVLDGAESSGVLELVFIFPELDEPEFKDLRQGYTGVEPVPAVLINTGAETIKVKSVALEGPDKDCFTLSSTKGGSIPSGQRDDSTWTVAPVDGLEVGEYEAEIVFTFENGQRLSEDFDFEVRR